MEIDNLNFKIFLALSSKDHGSGGTWHFSDRSVLTRTLSNCLTRGKFRSFLILLLIEIFEIICIEMDRPIAVHEIEMSL